MTRKAARLYFQEGQRYDMELGDAGSAFVQGSFAYKSDLFFSTENNPIVGQDAYTLYGARLGYESADAS